jgi:2-phosphoglycerate kinase
MYGVFARRQLVIRRLNCGAITYNPPTAIRMTRAPKCIVIGGPNGAGKTTFAREFLPRDRGVLNFLNADLIAAGRALRRAGQVARKAAHKYGTPAYIEKNGKIVAEKP